MSYRMMEKGVEQLYQDGSRYQALMLGSNFNPFSLAFFWLYSKMSLPNRSGPYWSNPPFLIFDIRAFWRSVLSARAPECQKLKNGGFDQYGPGRFEVWPFGTTGL